MIITPTGATPGVETNAFVDYSGSVVLHSLPPTNSVPCFGLEVLSQCYIVTMDKIELKKVNYNHCDYPQLHLLL